MIKRSHLFIAIAATVAFQATASDKYPPISDELSSGRTVWLGTCESCHGYGIASAPIPKRPTHRSERVLKDKATLYSHAINGFSDPSDTYMPPRGGNTDLNDKQVKAAVDYMLALANFYLQQSGN